MFGREVQDVVDVEHAATNSATVVVDGRSIATATSRIAITCVPA